MGETAIRFLIRYRLWVLAVVGAWGLAGLWVLLRTPIDAVPDLSENQVLVYADWPGQGPPEIERRITRPMSLALQGLPGVRSIRGSSDVGSSLLYLIFADDVAFDEARRRVAERLGSAKLDLPPGVAPRLSADGIPTGQIFWYTVEGTKSDLAELRMLQDTVIAPQLRSVPGVAEVAGVGGFTAEYHVVLDAEQMAAHGLTLSQIETALRNFVPQDAGNVISGANAEFLVRTVLTSDKQDQPGPASDDAHRFLRDLESRWLVLPDERTIQLSRIARLEMGPAPRRGAFEKRRQRGRRGNRPSALRRESRGCDACRPPPVATDWRRDAGRRVACPLLRSHSLDPRRGADRDAHVGGVPHRHFAVRGLGAPSLANVAGHYADVAAVHFGGVCGNGSVAPRGNCGCADQHHVADGNPRLHRGLGRFVDRRGGERHPRSARAFRRPARDGRHQPHCGQGLRDGGHPRFSRRLDHAGFLPAGIYAARDRRTDVPAAGVDENVGPAFRRHTDGHARSGAVRIVHPRSIERRDRKPSGANGRRSLSPGAVVSAGPSASAHAVALLDVDRRRSRHRIRERHAACRHAVRGSAWLARRARLDENDVDRCNVFVLARLSNHDQADRAALRLPLDEGMVMDMPITVPGITIAQGIDDLKARNMVLCRFPEVLMVTGKVGRADTPFDPAPLDMIETMVEFRRREYWPHRRILREDARRQAARVVDAVTKAGLAESASDQDSMISDIVDAGLVRFDAVSREVCWQRLQLFQADLSRELAIRLTFEVCQRLLSAGSLSRLPTDAELRGIVLELSPADVRRLGAQLDTNAIYALSAEIRKRLHEHGWIDASPTGADSQVSAFMRLANLARQAAGLDAVTLDEELASALEPVFARRWKEQTRRLNLELRERAARTWTQIVCQEIFARQAILDDSLAQVWSQIHRARYGADLPVSHHEKGEMALPPYSPLPFIDPHPKFDRIVQELTDDFRQRVWLWPHDSESLCGSLGEMDRAVQMPGWANVWTRPIQNRVDMLATGVNSEVGVRVLGRDFDAVVEASERLAQILRTIPGAADVVADPIRGRGYVNVELDPRRISAAGVALADVEQTVGLGTGGRVVGQVVQQGISRPMRLTFPNSSSEVLRAVEQLPIPVRSPALNSSDHGSGTDPALRSVPLVQVAEISIGEGPATIKSENGWLRNYVRLRVRDRDPAEFVVAAQREVQQAKELTAGVFLEWTGQYEHAASTRRTLMWMTPFVALSILAILFLAFRDLGDAALMMLAVPGALAGGALCQWMLGFPFSVAVGVGYIACFGMAAATSMVMLVYLREAERNAGGLAAMSLIDLREAVMNGAVHRLRPKLLTEATTVLSLAPMLWSSGVGADVVRPMAAPVLGGILIADEVVDLLLPVAFFALRRYRWRKLHAADSLPVNATNESAI